MKASERWRQFGDAEHAAARAGARPLDASEAAALAAEYARLAEATLAEAEREAVTADEAEALAGHAALDDRRRRAPAEPPAALFSSPASRAAAAVSAETEARQQRRRAAERFMRAGELSEKAAGAMAGAGRHEAVRFHDDKASDAFSRAATQYERGGLLENAAIALRRADDARRRASDGAF